MTQLGGRVKRELLMAYTYYWEACRGRLPAVALTEKDKTAISQFLYHNLFTIQEIVYVLSCAGRSYTLFLAHQPREAAGLPEQSYHMTEYFLDRRENIYKKFIILFSLFFYKQIKGV